MLELKQLTIAYGQQLLFEGLDQRFESGSITCIQKTGVLDGGSSLLKCCAGLIKPVSGHIEVDGEALHAMSLDQRFRAVAYCFEQGGLVSLFSVYNNIALPLSYHGRYPEKSIHQRIIAMATRLGVQELLEKEPHQLNDVQTSLVNLARALIAEPRVILLDEIQAGMSAEVMEQAMAVVKEEQQRLGLTVVMITTLGDMQSFADRCLWIKEHQLVDTL